MVWNEKVDFARRFCRLFLLGHACWSYLLSKITAHRLHVELPVWLAFLGGILPDFDIFVHPLIVHHTYTHSLLVLVPVGAFLTFKYRRLGLAFTVGIFSHLLTDWLVGTIPILYPLSLMIIGLDLGIPGLADTALETGALTAAVVLGFWNKDYLQFLKPNLKSLMLVVPMLSLVLLSVLYAGDANISLAAFAFSRRALTLITIGHAVLVGILALGVFQGIRAYASEKAKVETIKPTRASAETPHKEQR